MQEKLDYKKEYRDLYMPPKKPVLIDVPSMRFIMMDGRGDPRQEEYQHSVEALYALSYTIKMSKMKGSQPPGYFDYVVPPLEGLWWISKGAFDLQERDNWLWTSMIRQPEFVTPDVFSWALEECRRKKAGIDLAQARLATFQEGLCVQMMHVGPFASEPETLAVMQAFMAEHNLADETGSERKHHEIYLSDPRKTPPEKLKTVLRHPVACSKV
jgi:hypothetical protein